MIKRVTSYNVSHCELVLVFASILLFSSLSVFLNNYAYADSVVATIPVRTNGAGIATNPDTNRIYVAHLYSNSEGTVSVINGADNSLITEIKVIGGSSEVAVNPNTNKIYVLHNCCWAYYYGDVHVSVIDGNTNTVIKVIVLPLTIRPTLGNLQGNYGVASIVVNPVTNKIYVIGGGSTCCIEEAKIYVIDGAIDAVVNIIPVPYQRIFMAVNPVTNRIYAADLHFGLVSVIDGATNEIISTIPVSGIAAGIAVNPNTNTIYVPEYIRRNSTFYGFGNQVSVINGTTNSVDTMITVGDGPYSVGVNPVTNKVYVATQYSSVSVIDGSTNAVVNTMSVAFVAHWYGIAVNAPTSRIYLSHNEGIVSVIDGSTAFDFSMSAQPSSVTITQGQTANATLSIDLLSEPSQTVSLSASGLPAGTSATFTPQSGNPSFTSAMEIITSSITPAGTHEITVTGTAAGGLTRNTNFMLVVEQDLPPPPTTTASLTVSTQVTSGTVIPGCSAVLYQNNIAIATGYSPAIFTLNNSETYTVQVHDCGDFVFDHWLDSSSTNRHRIISTSSDIQITAVYRNTNAPT